MLTRKPSAINHVHIYDWGDALFIVPANYQPQNGTWVESPPVIRIQKADSDALAESIQRVKESSSTENPNPVPWDGENGQVWNQAAAFWIIRWMADGTLVVTPQVLARPKPDPATGQLLDSGWQPNTAAKVVLSGDAPAQLIAAIIRHGESPV